MIIVTPFFDKNTATLSYVAHDPLTKDAIVIDPVLDFDPISAAISYTSLDQLTSFVENQGLKVHLIVDTHVHADHMTGAFTLKQRLDATTAIGSGFFASQRYFSDLYEIDIRASEQAYDHYFHDYENLSLGSISLQVLFTPGHTPSCASILLSDAVFVGDALFLPHRGCGRTDFPGASAKTLYDSITTRIFTLPDTTRVFVGHDYPESGEEHAKFSSIYEQKFSNTMINHTTKKNVFVEARQKRDQILTPPRLLLFAMQVNILGGNLEFLDGKAKNFLKIPITK